jgi:KDO2-lipid IV(A) lauroyltransferase
MARSQPRLRDLFWPQHWLAWGLIFLLWIFSKLPLRGMQSIGRCLGILARCCLKKRYRIALRNIELCFPELSLAEQKTLAKKGFESVGMGFLECGLSWFGSKRKFNKLTSLVNQHFLEEAFALNRPVILLCSHMTTTEIAARLGTRAGPLSIVYRPLDSAVFEWVSNRKRQQHGLKHIVSRFEIKKVIRCLQPKEMMAILPDHDLGVRNSVFAPFFGVEAATITSLSKLCKMRNAVLVPVVCYRLPKGKGYTLEYQPYLKDFPVEDERENASRMNAVIESGIRQAPEQYFWLHRRFKHRPQGEAKVY